MPDLPSTEGASERELLEIIEKPEPTLSEQLEIAADRGAEYVLGMLAKSAELKAEANAELGRRATAAANSIAEAQELPVRFVSLPVRSLHRPTRPARPQAVRTSRPMPRARASRPVRRRTLSAAASRGRSSSSDDSDLPAPPLSGGPALAGLRDALARIIRIAEAIDVGDGDFARELLADLELDLARSLKRLEAGGR